MTEGSKKYWYNLKKYWYNLATREVEYGLASPMVNRAGPFDTAEEAAKAPELIRQRTQEWEEEEQREDPWNTGTEK